MCANILCLLSLILCHLVSGYYVIYIVSWKTLESSSISIWGLFDFCVLINTNILVIRCLFYEGLWCVAASEIMLPMIRWCRCNVEILDFVFCENYYSKIETWLSWWKFTKRRGACSLICFKTADTVGVVLIIVMWLWKLKSAIEFVITPLMNFIVLKIVYSNSRLMFC